MSRIARVEELVSCTPEGFARLTRNLEAEWLEQALARVHGDARMRRRKMPVDRAVWVVIAIALFEDLSIESVVHRLGLSLPDGDGAKEISKGALPLARRRLGAEPMEVLLELTGKHWGLRSAEAHRWRGLSVLGVDGSHLRIPDTAENEEEFGRPGSGPRGVAGYPQVRVAGLLALRSHVLVALAAGGINVGELTLAQELWPKVPDRSVTIVDRLYLSWHLLWNLRRQGEERHWLVRAKSNLRWRTVKKLGRGDELVEVEVPRALRKKKPEMPEKLTVRVLTYQAKGFRVQRLITSLLDPLEYPKAEVVALYHERWELEIGYDEIKTHMLERKETLRSKTPEGIRQELAGIGVAYNLVRVEMERVADQVGLPPTRFSFRESLLSMREFFQVAGAISPGLLPKRMNRLESDLKLHVLPRRRPRRYRRQVKIKMSNYPRNPGRSGDAPN